MSSIDSNSEITQHGPDFKQVMYQHVLNAHNDADEISIIKEMVEQSWLTEPLLNELELAYPSRFDITGEASLRNKESFAEKFGSVFFVDRIWSSEVQLRQAATHLLQKWCCKPTMNSKQIECYYCKAPARSTQIIARNKRPYNNSPSEKSMVQCPFFVKYTFLNYSAKKNHRKSILELRITNVNLEHTCQLNVSSLRESFKLSGSCKDLHRKQIVFALELLRKNPACDSHHLRPHLKKALPNWYYISSACMSNFRAYANRYWLKNHHDTHIEVTAQTIKDITKKGIEEVIDLDDPMIHINYQILLGNVMRQSGTG